MDGITLVLLFLGLMVLGVPIAVSLGLSGAIYILVQGIPIVLVAQRIGSYLLSFPLLAVTLFVLAGNIMNESDVTTQLSRTAEILVGKLRGGLAHVNIIGSLIFAGMSGSALADIGGLGKIEIETMTKSGYNKDTSAALTAASSLVGPVFPPSIPLVIYASLASVSATSCLIGGIIPSFVMVAALMAIVAIQAKKYHWPRCEQKWTLKEKLKILGTAAPAIFSILLLAGGLFSGSFSATELGALCCCYVLLIGFLFYRQLTFKKLVHAFRSTIRTVSSIMFVAGCASLYALCLTMAGLPGQVASGILALSANKYVILLLINVVLLIAGMFMDTNAAQLILVPIFVPICKAADIDLIHLGVIMCLNLMIGILTPPVGTGLFLVSKVSGRSINKILPKMLPYYGALAVALLLITYVPELVTWLPGVVG